MKCNTINSIKKNILTNTATTILLSDDGVYNSAVSTAKMVWLSKLGTKNKTAFDFLGNLN